MRHRYRVELYGTDHGGSCSQCLETWSILLVDDEFTTTLTSHQRKATIAVLCERCAVKLAISILELANR